MDAGNTACLQSHIQRVTGRRRKKVWKKNRLQSSSPQFYWLCHFWQITVMDWQDVFRVTVAAESSAGMPESEKGESKSRVLILQVSVNIWFVGDSVAGSRALGFILHACFRNTTAFTLMESFSIEIFFYSFSSILSHCWQLVVIANVTTRRHWISRISMRKSQKSSQRTFFIWSSDSKLKLPLKSKRRNTGSDHKRSLLLNKLNRRTATNWMSLSHQWEKKHHHWRKTVFSLLSGFGNSLVQHCGIVAAMKQGRTSSVTLPNTQLKNTPQLRD